MDGMVVGLVEDRVTSETLSSEVIFRGEGDPPVASVRTTTAAARGPFHIVRTPVQRSTGVPARVILKIADVEEGV